MIHELWYTSAPHGLELGTSGYCVVKATRDIPKPLRETLQRLSNYDAVFAPNHPSAKDNPKSISYRVFNGAGKRWHVLSKVQASGLDHTGRSNFFAHHLALEDEDVQRVPLQVFLTGDVLVDDWDGRVEQLSTSRSLPTPTSIVPTYNTWLDVTGDAGWAGAVAEHILAGERVVIAFALGTQTASLMTELLCLLPDSSQWGTTFTTFAYPGNPSSDCRIRFVLADSDEHRAAANRDAYLLDISRPLARAIGGDLVEIARNGGYPPKTTTPHDAIRAVNAEREPSKAPRRLTGVSPPPPPSARHRDNESSRAPLPRASTDISERHGSFAYWMLVPAVASGILIASLALVPIILLFRNAHSESEMRVAQLASEKQEFAENIDEWKSQTNTNQVAVETQIRTLEIATKSATGNLDRLDKILNKVSRDVETLARADESSNQLIKSHNKSINQLQSETEILKTGQDQMRKSLEEMSADQPPKNLLNNRSRNNANDDDLKLGDLELQTGIRLPGWNDGKPKRVDGITFEKKPNHVNITGGSSIARIVPLGKDRFECRLNEDKVCELWFQKSGRNWSLVLQWTDEMNLDRASNELSQCQLEIVYDDSTIKTIQLGSGAK